MYRATTPTFIFTFPPEADIEDASAVYVTFSKGNGQKLLTKTGTDLNIVGNDVEVYLTQEETLTFPAGAIKCQLNWLYEEADGTKRACSQIMTIFANRNLIEEVL